MNNFRERLKEGPLLSDGAMGTEIYRRGVFINRCYDALNLNKPDLIRKIHEDYAEAGADILTTNTYGAHRLRLGKYGLENQLSEVISSGDRLAREAAEGRCLVAGSIGPLPMLVKPSGPISGASARETYREAAEIMLEEGVDLIVLETFRQLGMLEEAVEAVRSISSEIPLAASFAFKPQRHYFVGSTPEEVASTVGTWDIDILGTNCVIGPQVMLDVIERLQAVTGKPLMAMPNAGQAEIVEGRSIYLASPEYMGEYTRRLFQAGAQIVGGCCGTTPEMVSQMRSFLSSAEPKKARLKVSVPERAHQVSYQSKPVQERSRWGSRIASEFAISVELDAPRGLDPSKSIEGAKLLASNGIQAVNIADGPRATARMSALALALQVREHADIDVIVHYCCRDRNLLGMQMDLLGAHSLGIRNLLCVTGDPPKMGNYPDATGVFDLDSVELVRAVHNLNHGIDFGGDSMEQASDFVIGCGCNPGHRPFDKEIEKFRRKLDAGAEFVFSQPLYDPELLDRFLEAIRPFPHIPFLVGILPLASAKNAEFLHNEVPGMQVPAATRARMEKAEGREAQRREGIRIAGEALRYARSHDQVTGAYIFPPFGRYSAILDVLEESENLGEV